jgi:hypothetical protein
MKIKVEPFLMKKGNRVAKAAVEFEAHDGFLAGFYLVGFTICNDEHKGLFVLFPSSIVNKKEGDSKPFFFLRPSTDDQIADLESLILDHYDSMVSPRAMEHAIKSKTERTAN